MYRAMTCLLLSLWCPEPAHAIVGLPGHWREANPGEFGAVGRLSTGCTGTLIEPNVFLTAEHCILSHVPLEDVRVDFPNSVGLDRSFRILRAERVPWVGSFTYIENYGQDLALLFLEENVVDSLGLTPIPLLNSNNTLVGTSVLIMGYGNIIINSPGKADHEDAKKLRVAESNVIGIREGHSGDRWGQSLVVNSKYADSCSGDSGSPLITKVGGKYFVAGTLFGSDPLSTLLYGCAPGDTNLYTNVVASRAWLNPARQRLLTQKDQRPAKKVYVRIVGEENHLPDFQSIVFESEVMFNSNSGYTCHLQVALGSNIPSAYIENFAGPLLLDEEIPCTGRTKFHADQLRTMLMSGAPTLPNYQDHTEITGPTTNLVWNFSLVRKSTNQRIPARQINCLFSFPGGEKIVPRQALGSYKTNCKALNIYPL